MPRPLRVGCCASLDLSTAGTALDSHPQIPQANQTPQGNQGSQDEPGLQDQQDSVPAEKPRRQRTHRGNKKLRRLYCPLHSAHHMLSCSVKRHLARHANGTLFAAPPGRLEAEEWAAGFGVDVLANQWLETLLCPVCGTHRTWCVLDEGNGQFQVLELPASVRKQLGQAAVLIPVTEHKPLRHKQV